MSVQQPLRYRLRQFSDQHLRRKYFRKRLMVNENGHPSVKHTNSLYKTTHGGVALLINCRSPQLRSYNNSAQKRQQVVMHVFDIFTPDKVLGRDLGVENWPAQVRYTDKDQRLCLSFGCPSATNFGNLLLCNIPRFGTLRGV